MIILKTKTKSIKNKAFTLAEVLITLAIIGVVAAMTIPNLLTKVEDAQFKTAAKKAFSKSAQAVQQMKMDNGGSLKEYHDIPNSFKPEFMKYFKILKDCGKEDCVTGATIKTVYKSLSGLEANTTPGLEGQFITSDGMFYNIQNSANLGGAIYLLVDVNGYFKKPNTFGKDVFAFQLLNDSLLPMGANGTIYNTASYCDITKNHDMQGLACMVFVMQDKDYPK